jgi:transcriptional regulator with XRE-family HTH domain
MPTNLGAFIRTQRERLNPATFGLSPTERRRTPGLRREELAFLCGVSVTWLTWLEQGRPVSASAKMLVRMADVLRLTVAERKYLFKLADKVDPQGGLPGVSRADEESNASAVVGAIQTPAYMLDRGTNVIAWNTAAAAALRQRLGGGRSMGRQPGLCQHGADWQEKTAAASPV